MLSKQPKALSICFFTEMWERFGYLLIQTLLIFVLLRQFGISVSSASTMVGAFIGLLFVTSVVAGYISDFFLGYLRSVIIGSVLLFFGYLCISITQSLLFLSLGLSVICVGTGLLKTNVSGFLGLFYETNDPKRDAGFTIFYIGINVGPVLGAITSSLMQNYFHIYHLQKIFFLSSIAASFAGLVFYFGYKYYKYPLDKEKISFLNVIYASILIVASIAMSMWTLYSPAISIVFFILVSVACVVSLILVSLKTREQIKNTIIYLLFLLISVLYFCLYNQIFISINIFNEIAVSKTILGFHVTPQGFVSIDNIGVIIFGVLVLKLWEKISDTTKFIMAAFSLCGTFFILLLSVFFTAGANLVSPWWIVFAYIVLAFSEICISPIGLALATKFAPENRNGLFIGAWLVTIGIGGELAGVLSKFIGLPKLRASLFVIKSIYTRVFIKFLIIAVIMFMITLLLAWFVRILSDSNSKINKKA